MSLIDSLFKFLKVKEKDVFNEDKHGLTQKISQEVYNKDIAKFKDSDNNRVEGNVFGSVHIEHYHGKGTLYDSAGDGSGDSIIAKKVKEIEKLQEKHKFKSAIQEYENLIIDYFGEETDVNDKFLILNALLTCFVNLHEEDNVAKYISKIKDLRNPKEIYRFHYMCSIFYLNKRDLAKSREEVCRAVELKPDYFKALCLKVFVECNLNNSDYDTTVKSLLDENEVPILGSKNDKDNSYVYDILGYISQSYKRYDEAIKFFSKSKDLIPSKSTECQIAIAHFNKAIENSLDGSLIRQKDVDFEELKKALSIFDELYMADDPEVNEYIKMIITPFYFRSLFLTNNFVKFEKVFDDIKAYSRSEKAEIYRIKALSELKNGTVNKDTVEKLDQRDKEWLHFIELMEVKNYKQVIDELSPFVWTKYKDDDRYIGMLLFAFLYYDDITSYRKFFKEFSNLGRQSDLVALTEGIYYEKTGDIDKAQKIIRDLSSINNDFLTYFELIYFYERNNKIIELEQLYEDLTQNKKDIIEHCKYEFYRRYFGFLFKNNYVGKAIDVFSSIKPDDMEEAEYLRVSAELAFLTEDLKRSAIEYEKLYDMTKSLQDLYNSLTAHLGYNNLSKAEEQIKILLNNNYNNQDSLYAMYSNIELLKGNADRSYDYAKKVKELEKDKPLSNAHPFYLQKSIRCNKDEGKSYIYEYAYNYPNHKHWYKSFKGLETDEQGNERLSQEAIDLFNSIKQQFDKVLSLYKNSSFGITTIARGYGQTLPQILDWRYLYNIKVSITSGNIVEVNQEEKSFNTQIVIDALGLYILAEIGFLGILGKLDKVYITYSTIGYLQQCLLEIEKPLVRDILKYIDESLNIELISSDYKISTELNKNMDKAFEKNQIDSAVFSYIKGVPYIYSDFLFKPCMGDYSNKFMSVVALLRSMFFNKIIDQATLTNAILNLKKQKYDFISFTASDIYFIAQKNNFNITDDIREFFKLEKNYDFPSFAGVYIEFFRMIYGKIEKAKFDQFFDLYVRIFDKYIKKSQYYFHCVQILFGSEFIDIIKAFDSPSPMDIIKGDMELKSALLNSPELNRYAYIVGCCNAAIRLIIYLFKDNLNDYQYYSSKLRNNAENITPQELDRIIEEGKRHPREFIEERPA